MTKKMSAEEILSLPMAENDAGAKTVGEYLAKLLKTLLEEEESFSGKRPFGNSGWIHEPLHALVAGGAVAGALDGDGYLHDADERQMLVVLNSAIDATLTRP